MVPAYGFTCMKIFKYINLISIHSVFIGMLYICQLYLNCFLLFCAVCVLYHVIMVPWVGLQCVIVVFAGHTHLYFGYKPPTIEEKWPIINLIIDKMVIFLQYCL